MLQSQYQLTFFFHIYFVSGKHFFILISNYQNRVLEKMENSLGYDKQLSQQHRAKRRQSQDWNPGLPRPNSFSCFLHHGVSVAFCLFKPLGLMSRHSSRWEFRLSIPKSKLPPTDRRHWKPSRARQNLRDLHVVGLEGER